MNDADSREPDGLQGLSDQCLKLLEFANRWPGFKGVAVRYCEKVKDNYRFWDVALGGVTVLLILGFVWAQLDPFGLGRASDMYSEQVIDRVMSPFYQSEAQDQIAVVLIDEDTLESQGIGWPPTYDYYSQLLYRIMRQGPRVVFVDILLENERPSDADSLSLAREDLSDYAEEFGVPIVFAQSQPGMKNLFSDIPGVESALSAWEENDYPLMISSGNALAEGQAGKTSSKTVAMKLYELTAPASDLKNASTKNLVVQWGSSVSPLVRDNKLLGDAEYAFVNPTWFQRWIKAGEIFVYSIMAGLDDSIVDEKRIHSPYTVTVQAHELASNAARGLLEGKVVLVGVKVDGIADVVETPVNGKLPGVYQHAMALDNLMKYGDDYYTRPPFHTWLFILLAIVMAFVSSYLMVEQKIRGVKVYLLTLTAFLFIGLTLYFGLHHAPQNWIGLMLICVLSNKLQGAGNAIAENKQGESDAA